MRAVLLLGLAFVATQGLLTLGALWTFQRATSSLIDEQLVPISRLQLIADHYQAGVAVAIKVRAGTMPIASGRSELSSLKRDLKEQWTLLLEEPQPDFGATLDRRASADQALVTLDRTIATGNQDQLDFLLSGGLYGSIDPLLVELRTRAAALREQAQADRRGLWFVVVGAQASLAAMLLLAMAVGVWLMRSVHRSIIEPLVVIAGHASASGDVDAQTVPYQDFEDEVGGIARGIADARARARETRMLVEERAVADAERRRAERLAAEAARQRAGTLDALFCEFGDALSAMVADLAAASEQMGVMADGMSDAAGRAEMRAVMLARSFESTGVTISHIEEASGVMLDIGQAVGARTSLSLKHGGKVHDESRQNRAHALQLGQMVREINGALDLISSVAKQTNLLALNAGIEASRAGDAGRGFAVVAAEVKSLSHDAQRAAHEISRKLDMVRGTADEVLASATAVETLAQDIARQSREAAEAVETHKAANRSIVESLGGARAEMNGTVSAMNALHGDASDVRRSSQEVQSTSRAVARRASELRNRFDALARGVRAA
ncbi:hypothetical protein BH10PSE13_BH10PSE13_22080 [soil metagenome]